MTAAPDDRRWRPPSAEGVVHEGDASRGEEPSESLQPREIVTLSMG